MKTPLILFICFCLFFAPLSAQNETTVFLGLSTGAGATVEQLNTGPLTITDEQGNPIRLINDKILLWGYHVPVIVPIQFGKKRWRAGVDLGYEYIHMTRVRSFDSATLARSYYSVKPEDLSYHLFKAGANFEYDFWRKKENSLTIVLRAGYYSILRYSYNTSYYTSPFMYGSIGLHASRDLPYGFQFVYGLDLDVQGYVFKLAGTHHPVFYQPEVTVGFKKSFAIRKKLKK